jgi:glycolate oxidase
MSMNYKPVTQQVITDLIALLGKESISVKQSELDNYSSDEMAMGKPYAPQVVVKPANAGMVASLLKFATENRIPVTPRGAGTGLSGGCVPVHGGILLSMERMNHIIKVDEANFTAVVEPGVSLADLQAEVEKNGLYYPIHLGEMTAAIGGSVATNAGGTNAVKYGVTRHQVLGLEAALPNGDIIRSGGEFVKCSTGYDITQLIAGSEGTLAVITRIILKLYTKPAKKELLFIPFEDLQNAIDAVPEILKLTTVPVGLEFMERDIIEIVEKYMDTELPCHQYAAFLMVLMEGGSEGEITGYFSKVEEICRSYGAIDAMMPGSERAKRKLVEAREKFYHALKQYAPMELIDAVVPRSEIARFVKNVKEISLELAMPVIAYGHAGDGNVHLHPVCIDMDEKEWRRKLPGMMKRVYETCVSYGGTISGEHGIGLSKKGYLAIEMGEEKVGLMKRLKLAFDPGGILNPGKIFDLD